MKGPTDSPLKTCRLCMKETREEMRNIFEDCLEDGEVYQLSSRIRTVASVQVEHGDCLPEQVCLNCEDQLNRSYTFKQICETSDTKFREQLDDDSDIEIIMEVNVVRGSQQASQSLPQSPLRPPLPKLGYRELAYNPIFEASSQLPYVCSLCNAGFTEEFLLKLHVDEHCQDMQHMCKRCGCTFDQKVELMRHMRVVHNYHKKAHRMHKPRYSCTVCNKLFFDLTEVLSHQKMHAVKSVLKLQCVLCFLVCKTAMQYQVHLKIHNRYRYTNNFFGYKLQAKSKRLASAKETSLSLP